MNYKQRGKELREIIRKIRNHTFEYESREPKTTKWTKYDQAQIHEFADFLNNVREVVDEAERRINERTPQEIRGPGRPPISHADITKALLLQTYTGSPNRVAEGLLFLFREKLGIGQHFSYKTIERGYDREPVNEILDEVNRILNGTVEGTEVTFSFDGSGFSTSQKGTYAAAREKQRATKKKTKESNTTGDKGTGAENLPDDTFPQSNVSVKTSFMYSVISIGVRHKLVAGVATCPDHSIGETTMFPEVFSRTLWYHPKMEVVLGDGIYSARWIVDLVAQNEIQPYFLPRSNVTFKSKGYSGWHTMLFSLQTNPQEWLRIHHMRSISETVNFMVQCRFGQTVRKKLDARKDTEVRLKYTAHNIRRFGYLEILEKIRPTWQRKNT